MNACYERDDRPYHQEISIPSNKNFRGFDPAFVLSEIQHRYTSQYWSEPTSRADEISFQADALVSFFENHGIKALETPSLSDHDTKGDHKIKIYKESGIALLKNLPGKLGKSPDPDFSNCQRELRTIPLIEATPEEYLNRMLLINQQFNAEWLVAGATVIDGKLVVYTTLPMLTENTPGNAPENFLGSKGFLPVESLEGTFYSSAKDLLIVLAKKSRRTDAIKEVMPSTDFLIFRPTLNLKMHFGLVSDDLMESPIIHQSQKAFDSDTLKKAYDDFKDKNQIKVEPPNLPCSIEQALAYLVDNKNFNIKKNLPFFKAFLAIAQTPEEGEIENKKINELISEVEEIQSSEKKRLRLGFSASKNYFQKLEDRKNTLKTAQEIKKCRDHFRTNKEIHPELKWKGEILWHCYSRSETAVDGPTMMGLMGGGFRDFWDRYRNDFQTKSEFKSDTRARLSETRKKVAKKGSLTRDREQWLKLTEDFVCYTQNQNRSDRDQMLKLLDSFLKSRRFRDSRTIHKKKEFLGVLINLCSQPIDKIDYADYVAILTNQKIRNVSSDGLKECFEIINEVCKIPRQ